MDPFEVFPSVVWENIYEQIDDFEDKFRLINLHPSLTAHFEEQKTGVGFLAALPIVMDFFERDPEADDMVGEVNQEHKRSVLKTRLVSKGGRRVINKWFNDYWEFDKSGSNPQILSSPHFRDYAKLNDQGIDKFWDDFGNNLNPNHMPFLSRSVRVAFPFRRFADDDEEEGEEDQVVEDDEENQNEREEIERERAEEEVNATRRVEQVFVAVGKHVKNVAVALYWDDIARNNNAIELWNVRWNGFRNILQQTTSLRSLFLFVETPPFMKEMDPTLQSQLYDLPDLPTLTHISWQHGEDTGYADLSRCEKYFPQLLELSVIDLGGWKSQYLNNAPVIFPKLTFLKVSHFNFFEHMLNRPKLVEVFELLNNIPLIDKFTVNICLHAEEEETELANVAKEKESLIELGTYLLNEGNVAEWRYENTNESPNSVTFSKRG